MVKRDLLKLKQNISLPKTNNIDMSFILNSNYFNGIEESKIRYSGKTNDIPETHHIDDEVVNDLRFREVVDHDSGVYEKEFRIKNTDRTVGAKVSNYIIKRYKKDKALKNAQVKLKYIGSAGQSFGAFVVDGMELTLIGDANDYLGKGMSGGRIIVKPYDGVKFDPYTNIIAGNVLLYGATDGEVYIRGRVGERFAVRNSGCKAVVEGLGDHGCEYMTGGVVVVLGRVGKNFGAGMSNGIAFCA